MSETAADDVAGLPGDLHAKMEAVIGQLIAETSRLNAETGRISAETSRINRETRAWPWFPIVVALVGNAGLTGIVVAIIVAALRR